MSAQTRPYNVDDPTARKWTERAYNLLESGELKASIISAGGVETARADGKCPYCEDTIHYLEVRTAVTEGTEKTLGADKLEEAEEEARYGSITVTCGCGVSHPNDPTKGTGCGTTFRLEVLVQ